VETRRAGNEGIATERLSLQRPTDAAIDLIYSLHSDLRACQHNPADMLTNHAEAETCYQRWDQHWRDHGFGYWVVHARRRAIGVCGLKVMALGEHDTLNLFYRLSPSAWGCGFATEAATAVVQWADFQLPSLPVIARVRPANVASQRVAENAGLKRADQLDTQGEDGLDWIFARRYPSVRTR
jgi:RimJ/RimL family protein N-acetyltransferase